MIPISVDGDFHIQALEFCAITGMTMGEMFQYMTSHFIASAADVMPEPLLLDARRPRKSFEKELKFLENLVESLTTNTVFIDEEGKRTSKIISVGDDYAVVEVDPAVFERAVKRTRGGASGHRPKSDNPTPEQPKE